MANDICVRFGRRLKHVREKKGIKQIELSEHTGIARTYISKLENGRTEICLKRLEELSVGRPTLEDVYLELTADG